MASKPPKPPKPPAEVPEQSEIKNSLRPVRIDITERDIAKGNPMDPSNCAAAQSIMRTLKADQVRVHRGVVYVHTKGNGWRRFKTSSGLRIETIVFDRGGQFIPGEYDLQAVPLSQSMPKKKKAPSAPKSVHKVVGRRHVISHVRVSARTRTTEEGEE